MCYYFFFLGLFTQKKKKVDTIKSMSFGRLNQLFRFTIKDGICVDSKPGKLTRCQSIQIQFICGEFKAFYTSCKENRYHIKKKRYTHKNKCKHIQLDQTLCILQSPYIRLSDTLIIIIII
jgi:hypothetical protein